MSEAHTAFLKANEVAEILGVGVSTVKRLVNDGHLPARLTVGRHRRIEPCDVLRLVHSGNYPCAKLDRLTQIVGLRPVEHAELGQRFYEAIVAGDELYARALLLGGHAGGLSMARLGDDVVAPAMRRIGQGWEACVLDVYQEHRATQTCLSALQGLRERIVQEQPAKRPVAIGGGVEGDHYFLANLLIELMLCEEGWCAVNIGPNTPFVSFEKALAEVAGPKLLWLSCSYMANESAFVAGYTALRQTTQQLGVQVAAGGNALTEDVRKQVTFEHHGNLLAELAVFVRTIG